MKRFRSEREEEEGLSRNETGAEESKDSGTPAQQAAFAVRQHKCPSGGWEASESERHGVWYPWK